MRYQLRPLLRASIVGLSGGASAILFRFVLRWLSWAITGSSAPLAEAAGSLTPLPRVLIPLVGSSLAGLVLWYAPRLYRGQHAVDYLEAVHLEDGQIPVRPTLWRSLASILSIVTGAPIGREGSMIQLSALTAAILGQRWRLPPERLRLCVACGVASGVATAYQAPLAGAFFASEIVLGALTLSDAGPLLVAAATGAALAHVSLGATPIFAVASVAPFSAHDLIPGLLLACAAGLVAPVYQHWLAAFAFLRQWPATLAWGGLVVGLTSLVRPEVWGNGETALHSVLTGMWDPRTVLLVAGLRLVATSAAVGSGAIGGVFTPTLLIGSALGLCAGELVHALHWTAAMPAGYVLLGMACLMAAVTHAPLMAVLMVMELTGQAGLVVPLLLGSVLAWQIAHSLHGRSLYSLATPQPATRTPAIDLVRN